jgi:hypothetical protein
MISNSSNFAGTLNRLISLQPIRQWLDSIEVNDPLLARSLDQWIPASCPFEREIWVFNRKILSIPPLCKLNPFYDQIVALRFKALIYLAGETAQEVNSYISYPNEQEAHNVS